MDNFYSYYDYMERNFDDDDVTNNKTERNEYETPKNMEYITPSIFLFTVLIACISIICCIGICYRICRAMILSRNNGRFRTNRSNSGSSPNSTKNISPSNSKFNKLSTTSMILTIICVFLYTFESVLDPFAFFTRFIWYNPLYNYLIYIAYNLIWISAKISFYLVLIHRYYLIFDASYFADPYLNFKKLFIFGMFTTILLTQLLLYFGFFLVYYEFINDNLSNPYIMRYASIAFLILDVLLISILGYLFTTSILKLVIQIQTNKEKDAMFNSLNRIRKLRSLDTQSVTGTIDHIYSLRDNAFNTPRHPPQINGGNNNNNNNTSTALPECDEASSSENDNNNINNKDDINMPIQLTLDDCNSMRVSSSAEPQSVEPPSIESPEHLETNDNKHMHTTSNMTNLSIYSCHSIQTENLNLPTPANRKQSVETINTIDSQQSDYYTNTTIKDILNNNKAKINLNLTENESTTKNLNELSEQKRMDTISIIHHKYRSSMVSSMPEYAPTECLPSECGDDEQRDIIIDGHNHKNNENGHMEKNENNQNKTKFKYHNPYHDYYNKKQIKLLNVTSRIALTSFIAMISSLIYQLIWLIGLELNNYSHLVWFNYTWCLDGIITIICVYLQMGIAKPVYKTLCIKSYFGCHKCTFKIMQTIAKKRTHIIHKGQIKNLSMTVNNNSNTVSHELHINMNGMNMSHVVNTITSPKYIKNDSAQINR